MANLWERFNGIANTEEVNTAKKQFEPIKAGTYRMRLEEFKADENRDGLPMVKGRFRTDTNKVVFYNQQLQNLNYPDMTATNIAKAVQFVSCLLCKDIEFTTLGDFADTIATVPIGDFYEVKVSYATKDIEEKYPLLEVLSKETELPFN